MAESFPYLLSASKCVFRKTVASRTGGRSLTGSEFVVVSDAGFWSASMEVPVYGSDRTLAYQGFYAALDGMAGVVRVPCFYPYRPIDMNGRMVPADRATGIGGHSLFDHGGIGYEETPLMWVAEATTRRATRMRIRHPNIQGLRPGHYFGIGDRLYLVARTWQVASETIMGGADPGPDFGALDIFYGTDEVNYGNPAPVTIEGENASIIEFWPPLREDAAADVPLILGRPVCKMRLASDDTGVLDLDYGIIGRPVLEFEEVI
jgi:hypothetical protein